MSRIARRGALALPALLALPRLPRAQAFPTRPLRVIVPFAAGGAADSAARTIFPPMAERLGQPIVVENRSGAGGSIGAAEVARAAPDGHTLLFDASSHLVNPHLMRGLPFDYTTAFTPISQVVIFPQVLAVKADLPVTTLGEFIALARTRPGGLSIGTQGNATAGHLGLVAFSRAAGIQLTHVPYRGGADAARDLAAGALDGVFITLLSARPIVDAGRARFIALASNRRSPLRPAVPTFAESGVPGVEISEWAALFAPAGTPTAITLALYGTLRDVLGLSEVRERLANLGAEPLGSTPEEFARFVARVREENGQIVREAGIRLD
ncbi:MAG: tripartite tricarboxylate transporter substrate-binding protein [Rhodovarius sp.]|nr:tripartite tricarboxylate transporter substrate-binding protein [Rhodovarius sp.]MDW8314020.1 tripartite tricarboxylate transporter substrate-binding protein [Rhodovarius sp.]